MKECARPGRCYLIGETLSEFSTHLKSLYRSARDGRTPALVCKVTFPTRPAKGSGLWFRRGQTNSQTRATMNLKGFRTNRGDTSLLDVLAIVAAVVVVLGLVLPMLAKSQAKASRINCVNNVKQIGLSFRLWAGDNNGKFPAHVSTNAGGTMELVGNGSVAAQFVVLSNELSTPKILLCPWDKQRSMTYTFATNLTDGNISYFVVPEGDESLPQMWLVGDRNLASNTVPLKAGLFTLKASTPMSWTKDLHKHQGNIGYADASVQQFTSTNLQASATNALHAYYQATTNSSFRIAIP